jgi:hypothetical protein
MTATMSATTALSGHSRCHLIQQEHGLSTFRCGCLRRVRAVCQHPWHCRVCTTSAPSSSGSLDVSTCHWYEQATASKPCPIAQAYFGTRSSCS